MIFRGGDFLGGVRFGGGGVGSVEIGSDGDTDALSFGAGSGLVTAGWLQDEAKIAMNPARINPSQGSQVTLRRIDLTRLQFNKEDIDK